MKNLVSVINRNGKFIVLIECGHDIIIETDHDTRDDAEQHMKEVIEHMPGAIHKADLETKGEFIGVIGVIITVALLVIAAFMYRAESNAEPVASEEIEECDEGCQAQILIADFQEKMNLNSTPYVGAKDSYQKKQAALKAWRAENNIHNKW